jgi:diguanylate cyclase (GGDEF)-like protein
VVPLHRLLPNNALARARFAALLYSSAGSPMLLIAGSGGPGRLSPINAIALGLLVVNYVTTYVRRRVVWAEPPVTALLIVLAVLHSPQPRVVIGLCICALTTQSMYGRLDMSLLRMVLVIAGFLLSMALSPVAQAEGLPWNSPLNLSLVPVLTMLGLLNASLYVLLQRMEQSAARGAMLAAAGQQLISLTDVDMVRATSMRVLTELCADWPACAFIVVRLHGDRTVYEAGAGLSGPAGTGPQVGGELRVPGLGAVVSADSGAVGLDPAATAALSEIVGLQLRWWGLGFTVEDDHRLVLVGARRRLPVGAADTVQTLAAQWSLAEASCRSHAELANRANSDQLTELPNRRGFFGQLAAARDRSGAESLALLLIDLDDFKQVNDLYGHAAGDALLVEMADRLTAAAGPNGVAARFGGDEFGLLVTDVETVEGVDRLADALRERLLEPIVLPEATVTVGASIGVALAAPELTAGDLMRCADIAMYSAKARGKNRVERFTGAKHGAVAHLRRIEEHLPRAVDRDEISVRYLPMVELRTGRCLGLEALARWNHPTIGEIPAATFIPLAGRTGHLMSIGRHVLHTACTQVAAWRSDPAMAQLSLSVNVAPAQLYDPSFAELVTQVLRDSGLPADWLTLDITDIERFEPDRCRRTLTELTDRGVRLAIDDFGQDSASFAVLRSFPVHQLKIDSSVVSGGEVVDAPMLRIAVAAAEALGIEPVAEGVETFEQAMTVCDAGVSAGQGSLYAAPLAAADVPAWHAARGRARAGADASAGEDRLPRIGG